MSNGLVTGEGKEERGKEGRVSSTVSKVEEQREVKLETHDMENSAR